MKILAKYLKFLTIFTLTFGCSSAGNLHKDNDEFYALSSRAKSSLKGQEYRNWLNKQLSLKRGELAAMQGLKDREQKVLGHYEAMEQSPVLNGNQQDIHSFKADRTRQNLHLMRKRRQMIERHIFYLNSQLSELDGPLKP